VCCSVLQCLALRCNVRVAVCASLYVRDMPHSSQAVHNGTYSKLHDSMYVYVSVRVYVLISLFVRMYIHPHVCTY